jgi:hypothetical protein
MSGHWQRSDASLCFDFQRLLVSLSQSQGQSRKLQLCRCRRYLNFCLDWRLFVQDFQVIGVVQ